MSTVTVKSTSQARTVESFQTAAHQTRRAAQELVNFAQYTIFKMDGGSLNTTDGLPSAAETYVRAEAQMKMAWTLLPEIDLEAVRQMLGGEYVAIEVAEKVD